MRRFLTLIGLMLGSAVTPAFSEPARSPVESELVLLTPVGKTLTDPALDEFARYAKQEWNVTVRTSAVAAGAPVAYGRVIEWNGRPAADILWGGEGLLFDRLAARGLLAKLELPAALTDRIPATIGAPKPIRLKDKNGFWIGTLLESYGIVYHPKVLQRLGAREPADWDDLLQPQLKGQVVQCSPAQSGSSHGAYEVILQREGEKKGWDWLKRLAANTGMFVPRSRDVPTLVARGEFAAGFAAPSYMALEDRLAGFDIKFATPPTASLSIGTIGILKGAPHPNAARAFIAFMLSERGQRVAINRGVFPIIPDLRMQGAPGSTAEIAVEFMGGIRSYYERDLINVYDEELADRRYEQVNMTFRREIETRWEQLRKPQER